MAPSTKTASAYSHGLLAVVTTTTARLVARDGTSSGLRVAMIVTPVILAILILALLGYFGYTYLQRRRDAFPGAHHLTSRTGGEADGVSPFTYGVHRRAVDLVAEMPAAVGVGGAGVLPFGQGPETREVDPLQAMARERFPGARRDEKMVLEERRAREDRDRLRANRGGGGGKKKSGKQKGSGSTTAPYSPAEHDPFNFIDRGREKEREVRHPLAPPASQHLASANPATEQHQLHMYTIDLTAASPISPASPTTANTPKGRRTKGVPTPIDAVVAQSFPLTVPSAPLLSDGDAPTGSAQLFPFTPLPQYPTSANMPADRHNSMRDSKLDIKRALDSPDVTTVQFPGEALRNRALNENPQGSRGPRTQRIKSKLKLQVVNAAIKKSRRDRDRIDSESDRRQSASTLGTNMSISSAPKPMQPAAGEKEPPFYSRPPSYAFSHGRSPSVGTSADVQSGGSQSPQTNQQRLSLGWNMSSPTSTRWGNEASSMFGESDIFPTGMSVADGIASGRRSMTSTRASVWSQDVQAVAGPSSRPMSPGDVYTPMGDAPPVPALPPTSYGFSPVSSRRASATSKRSRKTPGKGLLSAAGSAPNSAHPGHISVVSFGSAHPLSTLTSPGSAEPSSSSSGPKSAEPMPSSGVTPDSANPVRSSILSASSVDITSAVPLPMASKPSRPSPSTTPPPMRPERSAARLSTALSLTADAKSGRSVDVTSMFNAHKRQQYSIDALSGVGSDDGVPAIPPLPFDSGLDAGFGGSFGLATFGMSPAVSKLDLGLEDTDRDEVQSAGTHSVSNSMSGLLDKAAAVGSSEPISVAFPSTNSDRGGKGKAKSKDGNRSDSLPSLLSSPGSARAVNVNLSVAASSASIGQHPQRTASTPSLAESPASSAPHERTFGPTAVSSVRGSALISRPSIRRKPVPRSTSVTSFQTSSSFGSEAGLLGSAARPGRTRVDSVELDLAVSESVGASGSGS